MDNNSSSTPPIEAYLARQGISPEQHAQWQAWCQNAENYRVDITPQQFSNDSDLYRMSERLFAASADNQSGTFATIWKELTDALQLLLNSGAMIFIIAAQNFEQEFETVVHCRFTQTETWQCKFFLAKDANNQSVLASMTESLTKFAEAFSYYSQMYDLATESSRMGFGLDILNRQVPSLNDPSGSITVIRAAEDSVNAKCYKCDRASYNNLEDFCLSLRVRKALIKVNDEILGQFYDLHYFIGLNKSTFTLEDHNDFRDHDVEEEEAYHKFGGTVCRSYSINNYQKVVTYLITIAEKFYPKDLVTIRALLSDIATKCLPKTTLKF